MVIVRFGCSSGDMARPRFEGFFLVFLFTFFTFLHSATSQYDMDFCMTPENLSGTCINLEECSSLYDELRYALPSQRVVIQRKLNRYNCGYEGQMPKVCCVSTPTVPPPPPPPPPVRIGEIYSEPPPDVSQHRNLALLPTMCGNSLTNRIVGGNRTEPGEIPWMAALHYINRGSRAFECGGSVINDRYILTAAHCMTEIGRKILDYVRVGDHNLVTEDDCYGSPTGVICAPPYQDIAVERLIPHPGYTKATKGDDIGLIRLARPIQNFTTAYIEAICLPTTSDLANLKLENTDAMVSGWGKTENNTGSDEILKVTLPFVSQKSCGDIYNVSRGSLIGFKQVCAGGELGRDSCAGDSGGPLQKLSTIDYSSVYVQYGIVSFGPVQCGTVNRPAIYTRVPHYMDWILDQLEP